MLLSILMSTYLFFAVSTALIIIEPFVPGNFTYSSLGAGACVAIGVAKLRLPSASECRGDAGWSSDRRANTFVIILGKNRVLAECGWDLVDAALPGVIIESASFPGAVEGRGGLLGRSEGAGIGGNCRWE